MADKQKTYNYGPLKTNENVITPLPPLSYGPYDSNENVVTPETTKLKNHVRSLNEQDTSPNSGPGPNSVVSKKRKGP